MVLFDKDKLAEQLRALGELPQIKEVKALRQRLERELERLSEITKPVISQIPKQEIKNLANLRRSSLMKKKWNYIRQIWSNYPEIRDKHGLRELYSLYARRRRGEDISVPDVYWQNPSM